MHGLQLWVALPRELEESEPTFEQHRAATLPSVEVEGVTVWVLAGHAYGVTSPVKTVWPLFYVDVALRSGQSVPLPTEHSARGVFVVSGGVVLDGEPVVEHAMGIVTGDAKRVTATADSRIVMIGGTPLPEPRLMDWNFVASKRELIDKARDDWAAERFPRIPTDDGPLVPLPSFPARHPPA